MSFPESFIWGIATGSYQIEGGAFEDGKGPSVWDVFCRREGSIWGGHTGDVACDHYHRYKEDYRLMNELGIPHHRFSVSWPRVLPEGTGRINEKGLDFYDKLIDTMLSFEIEPWLCLFHWDYPYELFCRGGWLNSESPNWFAEYTKLIAERFSDRVKNWLTYDEESVPIHAGHRKGHVAPGLQLSLSEVLRAHHNADLAHGKAVQIIRSHAKAKPFVGTAIYGPSYFPENDTAEDRDAVRRLTFDLSGRYGSSIAWWADPLYLGNYPPIFYREDPFRPKITADAVDSIHQPLDFLGINVYGSKCVRAGEKGPEIVADPPGYPMTTQSEWRIAPAGMYHMLRLLDERYKVPLLITENGHQSNDHVMADGKVHDPQRIDYLNGHIKAVGRAIEDGADVRGYFQWTFMDNFEWSHGYKIRVGIVHVDFETQKRTPKDSAHWYKKVIATNGDSPDF